MAVNKNVVDDYYDNKTLSTWKDDSNNSPKKLKLKKLSIKKVSKKHEDDIETKNEIKKEVKPKIKKVLTKTPENEKSEKSPIKIDDKGKDEKDFSSEKNLKESLNTSKTDSSSKPIKKTFKPISKEKEEVVYEKRKKHKLTPIFWKKTRWRVWIQEEQELVFSRSNKINKQKKEEKKSEDVKQEILTDHSWETLQIPDVLSLKELSEKLWIAIPKLMAEFMKNWMMVNINSKIDFETASIISDAFDIKLERENSSWMNVEDVMEWNLLELLKEDDTSKLKPRPPVISVMWHVDHWKTSLLDYIRKEKVTQTEHWWITQKIWAYQVEHSWQIITFLDTPWHEAFAVMRARWAKLTDIAILVVAADEWVKPQTIESINHAKEAWIPVIVAINKMDKEWANPDFVKWQLSENWLTPEDWWWDTPMVPVSAISWFWIDDLLEIILLVSEMQDLKANPDRAWVATVIESHLDLKFWPVSTVLVNAWTLNLWDSVVCKWFSWKIKVLKDYSNISIKKAFPWEPVLIVWLDWVLDWWDILQIVSDMNIAKRKASEYKEIISRNEINTKSWIDTIMSKIKSWELKHLKIVLKADSNGSLEALKSSLLKLSTEQTSISIIHSWVWNINEWDVLMWQWSEAIIVWFNVWLLNTAKTLLEASKIEYIDSPIIYDILEKVEKIIKWMFDAKEEEVYLCKANVLQVFYTTKDFMIVWIKVPSEEVIESNAKLRVFRDWKNVWRWELVSLKQGIEEVSKLEWPIECWIKFKSSFKLQEKDVLEVYKMVIAK